VPEGPLVSSQAPLPAGAEGRWEKLERSVLEASQGLLGAPATELCAFEENLAMQHAADVASATGSERMAALWSAWSEFHGVAPQDDAAVSRALALLTPSLRFNTLFRRGGPPWHAAALRLPRLMLATAHLARAASALRGPLSLRALTELHQNTAPLRELLSRWDEPAVLPSPPQLSDAPPDLALHVRRAAEALSPFRGPARPLGTALADAWADVPPPGRALALALLARSGAELRFQDG
jgi:hypothetical protein